MMKITSRLVQEQQQVLMDQENISILTSASGDQASVSSENIRASDGISTFPQHYFAPPPIQPQPPLKKRRNLPGNPDPGAEVIALSPKTLMATNRFVCEVCNKGFQRDQNLQLHRRGHNLPWKLKQRTSNEVLKKKVYVCPEAGCVYHDPSKALGDLTGIKKHFFRKHGDKKWNCDKCSKRYAVQSDWKAHSKTCGTREYRCDCGTLFSRRDSFITHRAFCDALAEESARAGTTGLNPHQPATGSTESHLQQVQIPQFMINASHNHSIFDLQNPFSIKKEQQTLPPWLSYPPAALVGLGPGPGAIQGPPPPPIDLTPSSSSSASQSQPLIFNTRVKGVVQDQEFPHDENPNPNPRGLGPTLPPYHPTTASAHMSATALLQKAAQMGAAAISSKATAAPCSTGNSTTISQWCPSMTMISRPHHQAHVSVNSVNNDNTTCTTTGFGLNLLSSRDHPQEMALSSFGNTNKEGPMNPPLSFFHHQDHMLMKSNDGSTAYEDALVNVFLDAKKEDHGGTSSNHDHDHDHDHDLNLHHQLMLSSTSSVSSGTYNNEEMINGNGGNIGGRGGGNDEMTRDFLGLRALSHSDILNMVDLGNCINPNSNSPKSWQCDH